MATNYVHTYLHKMFVQTHWRGKDLQSSPTAHLLYFYHTYSCKTNIMTVAVGVAINSDGVRHLVETLEQRLKRVTKERDKYKQNVGEY